MELLEILQNRRSIRKYTGEAVSDENLQAILNAGLLSPSGRRLNPWEFIVVKDKEVLAKMAVCRTGTCAKMLENADCAIVVIANEETDVWVEDCSIVMSNMHLMASALGVGSCWIQGRMRFAPDGRTTEEYLRELLEFPENYHLEATLSLGMPAEEKAGQDLADLPTEKIHYEVY